MTHSRKSFTYLFNFQLDVERILSWSKIFEPFIFLNSNAGEQLQDDAWSSFDKIVAAGSVKSMPADKNCFASLKEFHSDINDWLFGYIAYDIKNQIEKLASKNPDGIKADDYIFFCPRYVFEFNHNEIKIHYLAEFDNTETLEELIQKLEDAQLSNYSSPEPFEINQRVSQEDYISLVNQIKRNIRRGDIYEMNFCIEFFIQNISIDPAEVYSKLNSLSPMPFSAYMHMRDHYLMCASPERFLARRKNKIISQPIKGTIRRGKDADDDEIKIKNLFNDPKERSENVMIVDLVRNDLSRTASKGSIKVEELFGIKTFKHLHQMISTITSEMKGDLHFSDVIKNAFPMGSMTGAPKFRAMQLIEEYESTKRGLFSGTIGYIKPDGDFDFNVIIRSIIYNSENRYLSYMAGSAITDSSLAEKEYDECMLKADNMKNVLAKLISA